MTTVRFARIPDIAEASREVSHRPTSAARQFGRAVTPTAAPPRNLPEGLRKHFGLRGRSAYAQRAATLQSTPAVERSSKVERRICDDSN